MRICVLDGEIIKDREMLHDTLAETLGFPDWYGRNLDALHDCLTDIMEETEIQIRHERALADHLGSYAADLKRVIRMTAEENERLRWEADEWI